MAKHNLVILNAQVLQEPKIFKDDKTNEYVRGICTVLTIRGVRDFGNNLNHIKYDSPIIMTGNPELIEKMADWHTGDMVEIKGSVTTKDVVKSTTCKQCGNKNKRKGSVVYINPIYLEQREKGLSREEGQELLKQRCEVSNLVTIIGPACREPVVYKTDKGLLITTYQVAIRRKYRIKDDSPENKTDFPWIKSYGSIALNDYKTIKKGTYLFIDGMIQVRDIERNQVCEKCGFEYKWKDTAMEIIPFATEYLRDYKTEEESKALENTENQLDIHRVLNEQEVDVMRPNDDPDYVDETAVQMTELASSILNEE